MSDQLPFCVTNHANRIGKFDSLLQKCKGEYIFLPKPNYQTLPLTFISDNNNFFVKTFFYKKELCCYNADIPSPELEIRIHPLTQHAGHHALPQKYLYSLTLSLLLRNSICI